MLGSPLLNNDFECIGLVMGANGMDCNNKGPIYFETLANSKAKNTTVYQLLSGGSTTVDQVDGMKLVPCKENKVEFGQTSVNLTVKANNKITSSSKILFGRNVLYRAGNLVELIDGFEASGDMFEARIQPCDFESKTVLLKSAFFKIEAFNNYNYDSSQSAFNSKIEQTSNHSLVEEYYTFPTIIGEDNMVTIIYQSSCNNSISLSLIDISGKTVEIYYKNKSNSLFKETLLLKSNLSKGIYFLKLTNGESEFTSKIIKP